MHWFSASVRRQHPGFLQTLVLTLGHRVCSWPLPAPGCWAPAPPGHGSSERPRHPSCRHRARGYAVPASERTRGRGPGCSPPPAAPPLTCPVRVCRERKSSQSTSRVRRGLELRSGFLSLLLEELGSAAAAMTPSRQPPTAAESARPRPSLAGFVALRWRKTTAPPFAVRVGPTLSVWQTRTGTNQEQDSRARRECGWLVRTGTLWWCFSRVTVA